jgi:GTPase SAR1 family protein
MAAYPVSETIAVFVGGAPGTGKSTFCQHIKQGESFNPRDIQLSTIQVDFLVLEYFVGACDEIAKVLLLDSPGKIKPQSLTPTYVRNCDVYFFIYDITNYATFVALRTEWVAFRNDNCRKEGVISIVIGNKKDLILKDPSLRQVAVDEAKQLARDIGALHAYELSSYAMDEEGLTELLLPLDIALTHVLEKRQKERPHHGQGLHRPKNLLLEPAKMEEKGCCS